MFRDIINLCRYTRRVKPADIPESHTNPQFFAHLHRLNISCWRLADCIVDLHRRSGRHTRRNIKVAIRHGQVGAIRGVARLDGNFPYVIVLTGFLHFTANIRHHLDIRQAAVGVRRPDPADVLGASFVHFSHKGLSQIGVPGIKPHIKRLGLPASDVLHHPDNSLPATHDPDIRNRQISQQEFACPENRIPLEVNDPPFARIFL